MRLFHILYFALFVPAAASAQQTVCAALPTKPASAVGNTSQSPNRATLATALNSAELAAKKSAFEQSIVHLAADSGVQQQRAINLQLFGAIINSPDIQKQRTQLAAQVAAVLNGAVFQNQKTRFQNDL